MKPATDFIHVRSDTGRETNSAGSSADQLAASTWKVGVDDARTRDP